MEIILTGAPTSASEMERFGIVNRVIPLDQDVLEAALKVAEVTAAFSSPAAQLAKQAVKAGMCEPSLLPTFTIQPRIKKIPEKHGPNEESQRKPQH